MGRHALLDCESCHRGIGTAEFHQARSECIDCHEKDYMSVPSPNHVTAGFSRRCTECHQILSWSPAMMVDHDPFFPIFSGTHRGQWDACGICHTNPSNHRVFDCLTCHEHNQGLMDPAHQGISGYAYASTSCYSCHPTGEAGSFVDHDAQFFPIFSGKHSGKWDNCATCHTTPGNRSIYSCLTCHEHDRARMDDKHLGEVSDYSYDSASCLNCHPDGRKE